MRNFLSWLLTLSLIVLHRRTNSFLGMWSKAFLQIISPVIFLFGVGKMVTGWWQKKWGRVGAGSVTAVLAGGYLYQLFRRTVAEQTMGMSQLFVGIMRERAIPWVDMNRAISYKRINDIAVGTHPVDRESAILADLWVAKTGKSKSGIGIIYLHGSAWHYLDKGFGTDDWFRQLVGAGHLVLDVGYHLAPKSRIPEQLLDVKQAIHWLKKHGDEYGIDPKKIILMGGSAGGHLALMAAYTGKDSSFAPVGLVDGIDLSVAGVVSLYGPSDLISLQRIFEQRFKADSMVNRPLGNEWMLRWLKKVKFLPEYGAAVPLNRLIPEAMGVEIEDRKEVYQRYAPSTHVHNALPPTLILQGAHDWGIAETSRALYLLLKAKGAAVRYVEYPNSEHAFDLPLISPAGQLALAEILYFCRFLDKD